MGNPGLDGLTVDLGNHGKPTLQCTASQQINGGNVDEDRGHLLQSAAVNVHAYVQNVGCGNKIDEPAIYL